MALADGTVVINEIFPDYAGGETSWIELYNSSSSEVSLDFWQIDTGSDETAESYFIPFGDPIPSGGFLVLELGTTTLVITETGTLRLIGIDLETYEPIVADQVDYAISEDGHAYARVPDGS
ncbi:MAG: lamin tail domain-containing protein, partial [Chloroflexota bacterium]|nr:lamin tail domain-containing protein [Chloroflexota bacterium]